MKRFSKKFFISFLLCCIFILSFSFSSLAISSNNLALAFNHASARLDWDDSKRITGSISDNTVTFDYDFESDKIYVITLRLLPQLPEGEFRYESFSGYFNINSNFYFQTNEGNKPRFVCYRAPWNVDSPSYEYGEASVTDWWVKFDFDFPSKYLPTETAYYFDFLVYCKSDSPLILTFSGLEIDFLTSEEYTASYNTNKIINNQNENTDKILNGGHDSPAYDDFDKSKVNEFDSEHSAIDNKTSGSLSDSKNFVSSFKSSFDYGTIWYGLNGVTRILKLGLDNNWFIKTIVRFSLYIGSFAFILGMAGVVVSRFKSSGKED